MEKCFFSECAPPSSSEGQAWHGLGNMPNFFLSDDRGCIIEHTSWKIGIDAKRKRD